MQKTPQHSVKAYKNLTHDKQCSVNNNNNNINNNNNNNKVRQDGPAYLELVENAAALPRPTANSWLDHALYDSNIRRLRAICACQHCQAQQVEGCCGKVICSGACMALAVCQADLNQPGGTAEYTVRILFVYCSYTVRILFVYCYYTVTLLQWQQLVETGSIVCCAFARPAAPTLLCTYTAAPTLQHLHC